MVSNRKGGEEAVLWRETENRIDTIP